MWEYFQSFPSKFNNVHLVKLFPCLAFQDNPSLPPSYVLHWKRLHTHAHTYTYACPKPHTHTNTHTRLIHQISHLYHTFECHLISNSVLSVSLSLSLSRSLSLYHSGCVVHLSPPPPLSLTLCYHSEFSVRFSLCSPHQTDFCSHMLFV